MRYAAALRTKDFITMIREGEDIRVVMSKTLEDMQLTKLVGITGVVSLVCPENKTPGAYVHLNQKYMDEADWYLPLSAIQNKQMAEMKKKQTIISEVIL